MLEPQEDVKTDPSTVEPEVNQESVDTSTTPQVSEQHTVETPSVTPEVKQNVPQPDGRPEINYTMEALRIARETKEELERLRNAQTQPQQPQYSEAELTAYLSKPDIDDNQRLAIARELEKVRQKKEEDREKRITESLRQQSQAEVQRRESYDFVSKRFPNCFVRDNSGNIVGWNENDPVTRQIGYYMSANKELSGNPAGLMAAAKMAAFDLGIVDNPQISRKLNQTNAQLKKEQKKNLISGGGNSVPSQSSSTAKGQKLLDEYRKTNDPRVLAEILKMKGANFQSDRPIA